MITKKILITTSALVAVNLIPVVSAEEITLEKLNSRTKVLEGNLDMKIYEIKKLKKNKSVKADTGLKWESKKKMLKVKSLVELTFNQVSPALMIIQIQ